MLAGFGLDVAKVFGLKARRGIRRLMDASNRPARCICSVLEGLIPFQRRLRGTRNRVLPLHATDSRVTIAEKTLEDFSVQIGLLGAGRLLREPELRRLELGVGDFFGSEVLDGVDPGITDSVRKLLLLPPQDAVGEIGALCEGFLPPFRFPSGTRDLHRAITKSFPENVFLAAFFGLVDFINAHLLTGVEREGGLHEIPIQKRHASLQTPGLGGLVRSQTIVLRQLVHFPNVLFMELLRVRGFVEVQIPAKNLVGAFAR